MPGTAELDALIIRNIGDIEAAIMHAVAEIGPRLWSEVGSTVKDACEDVAWTAVVNAEEEDVWLAARSWLLPDQRSPEAEFWIGLDVHTSGDNDGEKTWLANFVASGSSGSSMAFWLDQRIVGKGAWKKILKTNDELVTSLRNCGFRVAEDDDRRLHVPMVLDRELLAQAFESDDFDDVMQTARIAVANVLSAAPFLEQLRDAARAVAEATDR